MVSFFLLTMMLSACTGRSLIPESMIPQSLKGEQATIFAGSSDQRGVLEETEKGKTGERILPAAGSSNHTETSKESGTGRESPETEAGRKNQDSGAGRESPESGTAEGEKTERDPQTFVYVHVCGHVKKPGVYKLSVASRVCDAISAAGGLDKEADPAWWNQAAPVTDGMQIRIPSKKEVESGKAGAFAEGSPGTNTTVSSERDAGTGTDSRESVNINTATVDQLVTIPGIGAKRAEDILRYREEHGKFSSVEDIKNVPGIGDGIYSRMKEHIKVD